MAKHAHHLDGRPIPTDTRPDSRLLRWLRAAVRAMPLSPRRQRWQMMQRFVQETGDRQGRPGS